MEPLEPSHTAGGSRIIGLTPVENSLAVSTKTKQCLLYNPEIPLLDISNKNTCMWALKDKCKNVHFSITCGNPKLETIRRSIKSETDELTVEYLYKRLLQSSEMSQLLHETTNTNKS